MDAPGPGGLFFTQAEDGIPCGHVTGVQTCVLPISLLERANALGNRFQKRAREWQERWPMIGDVRGLGAMQAIELVQSPEKREPAADEANQIVQYCYEHGLIVLSAGSYSNVIRVLVPLVATDAQMDEGLDVLEAALKAACEKKAVVAQTV